MTTKSLNPEAEGKELINNTMRTTDELIGACGLDGITLLMLISFFL